jgi:hypothetical protein
LTVPLFMAGTLAVVAAPFVSAKLGFGVLAMALAVGLQGRTHKGEHKPPEPFAGPIDVVARLFVEQWVTFPRFVLSGGFGLAWRGGPRFADAPADSAVLLSD